MIPLKRWKIRGIILFTFGIIGFSKRMILFTFGIFGFSKGMILFTFGIMWFSKGMILFAKNFRGMIPRIQGTFFWTKRTFFGHQNRAKRIIPLQSNPAPVMTTQPNSWFTRNPLVTFGSKSICARMNSSTVRSRSGSKIVKFLFKKTDDLYSWSQVTLA